MLADLNKPPNAYILFFIEQRKVNPLPVGTKKKDRYKIIRERWLLLSESDKDVYKEKSQLLREEYHKALIARNISVPNRKPRK